MIITFNKINKLVGYKKVSFNSYTGYFSVIALGFCLQVMYDKKAYIDSCKAVARAMDKDESKWVNYVWPFPKSKFK